MNWRRIRRNENEVKLVWSNLLMKLDQYETIEKIKFWIVKMNLSTSYSDPGSFLLIYLITMHYVENKVFSLVVSSSILLKKNTFEEIQEEQRIFFNLTLISLYLL